MKVAVSGFEHNAVMRPLALHGIDPAVLHTPLWQPERMVQEVRRALGEGTELFILNHVSNVFGAVCPLDEIGRLLSAAGVPLILDASQSAGVLELDVSRFPCLAAARWGRDCCSRSMTVWPRVRSWRAARAACRKA